MGHFRNNNKHLFVICWPLHWTEKKNNKNKKRISLLLHRKRWQKKSYDFTWLIVRLKICLQVFPSLRTSTELFSHPKEIFSCRIRIRVLMAVESFSTIQTYILQYLLNDSFCALKKQTEKKGQKKKRKPHTHTKTSMAWKRQYRLFSPGNLAGNHCFGLSSKSYRWAGACTILKEILFLLAQHRWP